MIEESSHHPIEVMDRLIEGVEGLHSSPAVVCRSVQLLEDPEFDVAQIEALLRTDPALSANLLRLVNSSFCALSRHVCSLREAISYLGARTLRLMILSFGLIGRLTQGAPAQVCQDFWRRALTIASAAARLSTKWETTGSDEPYTAGLLADVGVLLLAQAETERYVSLYEQYVHGEQLVAAEREQFGYSHAELGARLLCRWNLPEDLTGAVLGHHDVRAHQQGLGQLVVAADMLAEALWTPQTPRMKQIQGFLLAEFDIDLDGFISLAIDCKRDILNNADVFRVDLHSSIDCNAIRENALRQYKIEAIEAALDWDSIAAVMEQDCGRSFRPGR